MLDLPPVITPAKLRIAAMDLLTGREYSRAELAEKLAKRFDNHEAIPVVLDQLADEGLQSDTRFTEAFIRSRIYRCHGLLRIRQDIRQKGISDELVAQALDKAEVDWFELARELAQRKFGPDPAVDQRAKAKRMRFLQYRGFNYDQIKYALAATEPRETGDSWD
ncbi:MAG: regulatory protein RecX [Porticoccaceae bacterium]